MFFQSVDGFQDFGSNVSFISSSSHSVDFQGSSVVIIGVFVPFQIFGVNFLSFVLGQLVEFFHGFLVEQMRVGFQFGGGVLQRGQIDHGFTVVFSDNSHNVFSQPSDDLQGFVVFLQGLDEHHVSVTSLFSQGNSLFLDGLSSLDVPDQVGLGVFNFLFDLLSVVGGFVSDSFVLVSNSQQLSDLSGQGFFHGLVDFISTGLRVNVGLFQVVQ